MEETNVKRDEFLTTFPGAAVLASIAPLSPAPANGLVAGVPLPHSALAAEATQIARASEAPEIFRHSLRTFLFAELIARARGVDHDPEIVYVASILHDTGLSSAHMSASERFEVDGANVARTLMQKHGADERNIETVWDAIALHDSSGIARWKQTEVKLVNAGVNADFGGYLDEMQRADIAAVLRAVPRTNFTGVFIDAVAAVAARKPEATGNSFVTDVAYRRVPGFHLVNFCDEVRDDPFKGYT